MALKLQSQVGRRVPRLALLCASKPCCVTLLPCPGGIPIIRAMQQSLAADRVTAVGGILNGTTNYMLTQARHLLGTAASWVYHRRRFASLLLGAGLRRGRLVCGGAGAGPGKALGAVLICSLLPRMRTPRPALLRLTHSGWDLRRRTRLPTWRGTTPATSWYSSRAWPLGRHCGWPTSRRGAFPACHLMISNWVSKRGCESHRWECFRALTLLMSTGAARQAGYAVRLIGRAEVSPRGDLHSFIGPALVPLDVSAEAGG